MSACTLATSETDTGNVSMIQTDSDWQVVAISDVQLVQEMNDRLRAEGFADRRLVSIGPSAFLLFWR